MKTKHTLSSVAAFALALLSTAAGDWTQFRGPSAQGHSDARKLPLEWSDTKNVTWKVPIPGHGWSSPLLTGGKLFLTTAVPERPGSTTSDQSLRVVCLNAQTGKILWNTEVFHQDSATAPKIHKKNSHASPTPIIEDGKLYAHFGHQGTACLNLFGKVIWKTRELKYAPLHGGGGSPLIYRNLLIFSCDASINPFVVALDKRTGKVKWKTPRNVQVNRKFSFSTPLLLEVGGKTQLISPGSGAVCAYDPDNGKEIWRVRYGQGYSVVPRPVAGHGLVFVSSGYDRATLYAIKVDAATRGDVTDSNVVWQTSKRAPKNPSPLLIGDELYIVADTGTASCLDAKTGEEHWVERVGGGMSSSPVYADGRIYIQDEQGQGTVIEASKKFKVLAKNKVEGRTFATYALDDGVIFIRSEKSLYRIEG